MVRLSIGPAWAIAAKPGPTPLVSTHLETELKVGKHFNSVTQCFKG